VIQEGEILRESLVRILTGLKSGPGRLVTSYDGFETVFWSKRVGREISAFAAPIEQSTRRSGAERGGSAGGYLPGTPPGFLIRRS
jgi:hypothetical protein